MKKSNVLIIIPTKNDEEYIINVVKKIKKFSPNYDLLVINDSSSDDTEKLLNKYKIPHLKSDKNMGIEKTLRAGFFYAKKKKYDYVIELNGSGKYEPKYIRKTFKFLRENSADICIASQNLLPSNDRPKQKLTEKIWQYFILFFTDEKITDIGSGFKIYNKKAVEKYLELLDKEPHYAVQIMKLLKAKIKIIECPTKIHLRPISLKKEEPTKLKDDIFVCVLLIKFGLKKTNCVISYTQL